MIGLLKAHGYFAQGREAGRGDWPELSLAGGRGELTVQLFLSSLRAGITCMLDHCHQIGDTAGLCSTSREVAWQAEAAMRRQR